MNLSKKIILNELSAKSNSLIVQKNENYVLFHAQLQSYSMWRIQNIRKYNRNPLCS